MVVGLILLAAVAVVLVVSLALKNSAPVEAQSGAEHAPGRGGEEVIGEEELAQLPPPVQRYLRFSGVIRRPRVAGLRLQQSGEFRLGPDKKWMPFTAEQFYRVDPPGFAWYARMRMTPGLPIRVEDRYAQGRGSVRASLLGVIPMARGLGPEIDQAALLRYLNEMMWFPTALLQHRVTWEAIDDVSARATITDGDTSVSGVFHFDGQGRLVNFVAQRYRMVNGGFSLDTWSTPILEYAEFDGFRLPAEGNAVWNLPEGDFVYAHIRVRGISYRYASSC
ncbi:MAG: hypothetical protein QHH05_03330 [Syntrophomonadaceae bacterium]|jgi:hypothetical protein|nr:hypothetical protein [Syntrophomonadaceae bacterium]MDH7497462.1 hypothetical protein [Syntrophomonadaceae bacterium]